MAVVRAKAYVASVTHYAWNDGGLTVKFQASTKGEDNKAWAAATPNLTFELAIKNPIAADVFHDAVGKDFYIDITPIPEPE